MSSFRETDLRPIIFYTSALQYRTTTRIVFKRNSQPFNMKFILYAAEPYEGPLLMSSRLLLATFGFSCLVPK